MRTLEGCCSVVILCSYLTLSACSSDGLSETKADLGDAQGDGGGPAKPGQTHHVDGDPFGLAPKGLDGPSDLVPHVKDLGAGSVRLAGPLAAHQDRLQADGEYLDQAYRAYSDAGLEISVVVLAGNAVKNQGIESYTKFLSVVAERFDGDGEGDAPGSPRVSYWEIDNEPDLYQKNERTDWLGDAEKEAPDYAKMLVAAYDAIKQADSTARVAIAGMAHSTEYYGAILDELELLGRGQDNPAFDAFNYHYYTRADDYGDVSASLSGVQNDSANQGLPAVKSLLHKHGYRTVEIIITETGTYSGSVNGVAQSDAEQAAGLFKRYMYYTANQVNRVFWYGLTSTAGALNVFELMSLCDGTCDGPDKRAAYFTYKQMVELLGDVDRSATKTIEEVDSGAHVYELTASGGKKMWAVWSDSAQQVSFSARGADAVQRVEMVPSVSNPQETDYPSFFPRETIIASGGKLTLQASETPALLIAGQP